MELYTRRNSPRLGKIFNILNSNNLLLLFRGQLLFALNNAHAVNINCYRLLKFRVEKFTKYLFEFKLNRTTISKKNTTIPPPPSRKIAKYHKTNV